MTSENYKQILILEFDDKQLTKKDLDNTIMNFARLYHDEQLKLKGVNRVLILEDAKELLVRFWQRTSDACPLECTEAEIQESKFRKWVEAIYR